VEWHRPGVFQLQLQNSQGSRAAAALHRQLPPQFQNPGCGEIRIRHLWGGVWLLLGSAGLRAKLALAGRTGALLGSAGCVPGWEGAEGSSGPGFEGIQGSGSGVSIPPGTLSTGTMVVPQPASHTPKQSNVAVSIRRIFRGLRSHIRPH